MSTPLSLLGIGELRDYDHVWLEEGKGVVVGKKKLVVVEHLRWT